MKSKIFIIIAFISISCNFNQTFHNRESDRNEGLVITEKFYDFLEKSDYESAESHFGQKFYEVSSKEELRHLFDKAKTEMGNIKSRRVADWKTTRIEGDSPASEYVFVYEVQYEKFQARETIVLTKEGEEIKIAGYNIVSEGFFAK